jgi:hypothetical protein
MPESRTLGKWVGLHSAIFRKAVLQLIRLCLTAWPKWLRSAKGRLDITIDYPAAGSVFPPEFPPPEFLWRDAAFWSVEAIFADGAPSTRTTARGEPMRLGPLDPRCASSAELSVQQRNTRSWRPDAETWTAIKRHSVDVPATIIINGYRDSLASKLAL